MLSFLEEKDQKLKRSRILARRDWGAVGSLMRIKPKSFSCLLEGVVGEVASDGGKVGLRVGILVGKGEERGGLKGGATDLVG